MKVKITARKFKARDALKDYIQNELEALSKFSDDILDVEVILSYQNNKDSVKIAEIIIQVPGQTLTIMEESEEFEISIKAAVNKLIRQLQKIKEKKSKR
jgi:putative sigma-54 modulation protein